MIVFAMAVQPVACAQSSSDASAIIALQVTEQTQHEVQAELARAQAELARAMDEVNQKVRVKVNRELAARLAAQRGALLSNLSSLKAELAAMEQERSTQRVSPLIEVQESESGWLGV